MKRAAGLRCGRISYTNDIPVYAAFDAGAVSFPGTLTEGVPSALNRLLLEGKLDCSPISSYVYGLHHDELVLLPDPCIGSRRDVRSIFCVSKEHPSALRGQPVAVTTESATGRALFDVICRSRFGFAPLFVESDDPLREHRQRGMACILIGDKAIDAQFELPDRSYDLGALWHGLTSEGMVYAVWAVRRSVADRDPGAVAAIAEAMRASLDWGLAHLDTAVTAAQALRPRPAGFYERYYNALNYRFDRAARRGLRAFFGACATCGLIGEPPELRFFAKESALV